MLDFVCFARGGSAALHSRLMLPRFAGFRTKSKAPSRPAHIKRGEGAARAAAGLSYLLITIPVSTCREWATVKRPLCGRNWPARYPDMSGF
jgi:hypothetical protein